MRLMFVTIVAMIFACLLVVSFYTLFNELTTIGPNVEKIILR